MATKQPHEAVVPQTLWPTLGSLNEAVEHIVGLLPLVSRNDLVAALGTYHNTLLHVQHQQRQSHGH